MNDIRVAVILPAYNESLTIVGAILDFAKVLPEAKIIIVDNNSSDDTFELAQSTILKKNIQGKVLFEPHQGKGFAVRKAFTEIDADIYVLVDADLTYLAKDVHKLIQPVVELRADMVVGDRHSGEFYKKENQRNFHVFGNKLVKNMINFLFGSKLNDIMSGFRVLNKKFVKNYPIMSDGFELETNMTLHCLNKRFRIMELPINYVKRPSGSFSKLNTFSDGFKQITTIINIFRIYKPLRFYGILFMFFAALSLLAAYPVISDWIVHKYIYHIPLAILSTGLGIVSILSLSLGLILDAITHQYNVDYEHKILKQEARQTKKQNYL